jgi:TniQ
MSTSLGILTPLPSRVAIGDREGLDGYLERLAAANDLSTAVLRRYLASTLRSDRPSWAFFMVKPDRSLLETISRVGGVDRSSLANATLERFDKGYPLFSMAWILATVTRSAASWHRAGFPLTVRKCVQSVWRATGYGNSPGGFLS